MWVKEGCIPRFIVLFLHLSSKLKLKKKEKVEKSKYQNKLKNILSVGRITKM